MLGGVVGDMVGSVWEKYGTKSTDFPLFAPNSRFTDDTVLACAVAEWQMAGAYGSLLVGFLKKWYARYPSIGYGPMFKKWAESPSEEAYGSFGNGSAMRAISVGHACDNMGEVLSRSAWSALVTHNHPEGILGAQATTAAVFMARQKWDKADIRHFVTRKFGYDLSRTVRAIRDNYEFDATCQKSVPESITCFLETDSYVDAVKTAVSLGGDADTMAYIAGAIAAPYYGGVPRDLKADVDARLDQATTAVIYEFMGRHPDAGWGQ